MKPARRSPVIGLAVLVFGVLSAYLLIARFTAKPDWLECIDADITSATAG